MENDIEMGNDTTQRTYAHTNLLQTCCLCCGYVMGKSSTSYGLATGKLL